MNRVDVLINGAGPVGALTAVLMAQAGIKVLVVEAGQPAVLTRPASDGRAIALALSAKRCLEVGGFWQHLDPYAQAILDIKVTDGSQPLSLSYDHRDLGSEPFGWIVENEQIKSAALQRLIELNIPLLTSTTLDHWDRDACGMTVHLSDGKQIKTSLIVGAEGRKSPTRSAAGIGLTGWDYGQTAIVCAINHEKPHHGVAHEHFLPSGPFAILPMTGQRSGIVWTEKNELVAAIMAQSDAYFLSELSEKIGNILGPISLASPRFAYPLSLQMAQRFISQRLCLVGDAAHGMHPIAGQGMNMGIRDAAALAQTVVESGRLGMDVGTSIVLDHYERWRRFDTTLMMGMTDGLNRLFSNQNSLLATVRDLGLWSVDQCGPVKKAFSRHAMGVVGDLPRPLMGLAL
jgi:2-octaprenyl-6-methoxyphenol hydroxylase